MLGRKKNNNITQEKNVPLPEDFKLLSKTTTDINGKSVPGIDVATHCIIAGLIAREIINTLPESLKFLFPEGTALVAALHDIGKANPDFQKMIYQSINGNLPECLQNANADNAKRNGTSFHALASEVILRKMCQNKYIPIIEGMHHGFRPVANVSMYEPDYGGEAWKNKRQDIMKSIVSKFADNNCQDKAWPEIQSWEQACAIGGLVITADWLASGGKFASLKLEDSGNGYKEQAEKSVQNAGFHQLNIKKGLNFKEIFSFEMNAEQKAFCTSVKAPGVYVLEAPMGIGKTEAALYAAYKSMEQGYARGIYFAMPTQLTSNKIYERMGAFLDKICENWQENEDGHLQLLHGNAWLYTAAENNSDDYHNAEIRSWFDGRKKGILAPFAVGTVDQALMAAMEVRHGMLRTFGLAGKVVILDEIHSYDAYTGTLLNRLVEMLRKTGCTVILLSATLTSGQKKEILGKDNVLNEEQYKSVAYPLITGFKADKGQVKKESGFAHPVDSEKKQQGKSAYTEISFAKGSDDKQKKDCIKEAVKKASLGQQVLWIENTVAEAQEIFKAVSARCKGNGIECGLIHSRFTRLRRSENEEYWVNIYGKKGKDRRREKGRILVGTQVLEQSIDIDADFLITHICPMDMLLQRMGRLWRHEHNNRPKDAIRQVLIISPEDFYKEDSFGKSEKVYSKYVLCCTMETLKDKKAVRIPDDIRGLMESTYSSDRHEDGIMDKYWQELNKEKKKLSQYASMAESKSDKQNRTESDFKPCTRYSETESVNIVMLKSLKEKDEGYNLVLEDGTELFIPKKTDRPAIQKISKIIIGHTVSVAEYDAPDYYDSLTGIFSRYVYTGNGDEHPFRAAFLDKDGYVSDRAGNHCHSKGCEMLYDNILGYRKTKKDIK